MSKSRSKTIFNKNNENKFNELLLFDLQVENKTIYEIDLINF